MDKGERKAFAAGFIKGQIDTCVYELGLSRKEVLAACVKVLEDDETFNKNYVILRRECMSCPFRTKEAGVL